MQSENQFIKKITLDKNLEKEDKRHSYVNEPLTED